MPVVQPVPVGWSVTPGSSRDGEPTIQLSLFTAQGEQHYFLRKSTAHRLAAALDHVAGMLPGALPTDDLLPAPLNAWLRLHLDGNRCSLCLNLETMCDIPPEDAR